jgi:hypothetical protein
MFNAISDAHYAGRLAQGAPAAGRDVCRDYISFMAILGNAKMRPGRRFSSASC